MKFVTRPAVVLVFIIFISFILRFYNVSQYPPSLTWDEVSIGYNAWSIWKTGRDEHGRFLPVDTFIAYGDYKPPVAIYLTVPFVALFGLTELAVRLPVVLFSTLTVIFTYFLVKRLFVSYKYNEILSLLSGGVLAISPWHINLSRAGFEAIIALFFVVFGVWWIITAKVKERMQLVMWIPFILALYTFNSARYFLPLFAPVIIWFVYGNSLKETIQIVRAYLTRGKRQKIPTSLQSYWTLFLVSICIGCLALVPIIPHLLSPEARLRFREVNIFTDSTIVETSNKRIEAAQNAWWAKILNNRRVGYGISYMKHYLDHFDPQFLFIKGDGNPKFSIQDVGQLYIIESVFLLIGWYAIFSAHTRVGILLVLWLLLAIVPAGVARETPHALRILNTLPVWQIVIAIGIVHSWSSITIHRIRQMFIVLIAGIYMCLVSYYLHNYYSHYPYEFSGEWQYGYREAIRITERLKHQYDHIVLTEQIGRAYMYTLFYGGYAPEDFWKTKQSFFDAAGFYKVKSFGKYVFVLDEIPKLSGRTLYVLPPHLVPPDATVLEKITLLNGSDVLTVYE